MAQHSLELPSHHTKQEMHKFPAFSLVEQRGRGGQTFHSSVYLWTKRGTNQSRTLWMKAKSTVSIHAVWGQSLGFWECLRMFIAVLQHLVGQSQNPLQQAQWKKKLWWKWEKLVYFFHFDIVRMLLLRRRYWTRAYMPHFLISVVLLLHLEVWVCKREWWSRADGLIIIQCYLFPVGGKVYIIPTLSLTETLL